MRAKILRMIETRCLRVLAGVAEGVALGVMGLAQTALAQSAPPRPAYPIVQEIHVDEQCRLLLAPAEAVAGKQKARFERDPVICHLETVNSSEHMEEAIVGNELRRSR